MPLKLKTECKGQQHLSVDVGVSPHFSQGKNNTSFVWIYFERFLFSRNDGALNFGALHCSYAFSSPGFFLQLKKIRMIKGKSFRFSQFRRPFPLHYLLYATVFNFAYISGTLRYCNSIKFIYKINMKVEKIYTTFYFIMGVFLIFFYLWSAEAASLRSAFEQLFSSVLTWPNHSQFCSIVNPMIEEFCAARKRRSTFFGTLKHKKTETACEKIWYYVWPTQLNRAS